MTDSRSPGKMKFMEGDDDFWEWRQGSRGTPGTLQQFIPDGRGGFVEGNELDLVSFNSTFPDQIEIRWSAGGDTQDVTNRKDDDTGGTGGIYSITT